MRSGRGNLPARTSRHSVVGLTLSAAATSRRVMIRSRSGVVTGPLGWRECCIRHMVLQATLPVKPVGKHRNRRVYPTYNRLGKGLDDRDGGGLPSTLWPSRRRNSAR